MIVEIKPMLNSDPNKLSNKIDLGKTLRKYRFGTDSQEQAKKDIKIIIEKCYRTIFEPQRKWTLRERELIGKAYHELNNEKYNYAIQFLHLTIERYKSP